MRELVIVISDLYLQPDSDLPPAARDCRAREAQQIDLPGLEHIGRFARTARLEGGWRPWTAQWLGLAALAERAPASVAAAALEGMASAHAVWLATPLHLIAGMTGVHLDRRCILRPPSAELEELAAGFDATFYGSGLALRALDSGELLLSTPPGLPAVTSEPARALREGLAPALPRGKGAAVLRRLGAEIEMWLHAHPLNERRARRAAPPISTLWVWGGGEPALAGRAAAPGLPGVVFGSDSYVHGLLAFAGGRAAPMPEQPAALIGYSGVERALCVLEIAELLHEHPRWSLGEAMGALDARLIRPALAALGRGELERLMLLANDRCLALRASDRWRLWRRKRSGLEALA